MALSLPAVRRIPLALATVVGLLLTTGFASARHVKMPGDLVASPSFVNLGNVGAGINTQVDVSVPANGTAQAKVFMGPASTGVAVMRVRWRGGSESTNWVTIAANGT